MTVLHHSANRVMVPRWRKWNFTSLSGELNSLHNQPTRHAFSGQIPTVSAQSELDARIRSFVERRGVYEAADLVSAASVLNIHGNPAVEDAALYILSDANPPRWAVTLARRTMKHTTGLARTEVDDTHYVEDGENFESLCDDIASLKSTLSRSPRNAVRWIDLARCYTALGQHGSAAKAIQIATQLAPDNRFVVRSAVRFHVHEEDYGKAHALLLHSEALRYDPWLLSAELAVANLAGRPLRNFRTASKMLQADIEPRHLSELAGSLSAIEYAAGRTKQARRLLRQALQDPNDNALAQAEWSAQHGLDVVNPSQLVLPMSFEARAIHSLRRRHFSAATNHGKNWLADQPFALDAAHFVTAIAGLLADDHRTAVEAARVGLTTNPRDPSLLNNLAFSLVNLGDIKGAVKAIALVPAVVKPREAAVLEATRGFIFYRNGQREEGNNRYRKAIVALEHLGDRSPAAVAALLWSREEVRFRSTDPREAFEAADRLVAVSAGTIEVDELKTRLTPEIEGYRASLHFE